MRPQVQIAILGLLWMPTSPLPAQEGPEPQEHTPSLSRYEDLQIRMAVPVRITVYAPDEATANQAFRLAYARFRQLDRTMSDYDPHSELSLLCREAVPGQPRRVSDDLFAVLQRAEQISHASDGAFDVTVGPLTELWRQSRRRRQLSPDKQRRQALAHVGWKHVRLDPPKQTVDLRRPGMKLDLGGIAKGYAADQALAAMAGAGVTIALVDAGGDIVAGDPPPGETAWRIGIAPRENPRETPEMLLRLKNKAVATSGDAEQHVEIDGVRYSHILDPRTGLGVTTPSSVTVIAPDGMTADALASAVSVLGPADGLKLIESIDDAEACVVTLDEEGNEQTVSTSGVRRYFQK